MSKEDKMTQIRLCVCADVYSSEQNNGNKVNDQDKMSNFFFFKGGVNSDDAAPQKTLF